MTEQDTINTLDTRLKRIEQRVYGSASRDGKYPEVVSSLTDMSMQLSNALSSRDRIVTVMKRLEELDEYMDPCYGARVSQLPDGALADLLLCQQEAWEENHQHLQQLTQLRPVLDSQSIRDCVVQSDRLVAVAYKQSDLDSLGHEQGERVTQLLDSYNSILQTITETLANMDEVVTRAEIAAQPKQVLD